MLEGNYSGSLEQLHSEAACDLLIPSHLKESLGRRGVASPVYDDERRYVRYHFNTKAIIEFSQTLPAISRKHTVARIVTRNVSRGGLAFLHSEQLFPGELVTLWLPKGKHNYRIIRCMAHGEQCFEMGAEVIGETALPVPASDLIAGDRF